ncbi:MAG: hypothetical protein LBC77_02490 [Spirochaetaceae bacterium]|jgi:hypothetical protein|nr:hypothetical protein [Spirochaetaceae bacterium]
MKRFCVFARIFRKAAISASLFALLCCDNGAAGPNAAPPGNPLSATEWHSPRAPSFNDDVFDLRFGEGEEGGRIVLSVTYPTGITDVWDGEYSVTIPTEDENKGTFATDLGEGMNDGSFDMTAGGGIVIFGGRNYTSGPPPY